MYPLSTPHSRQIYRNICDEVISSPCTDCEWVECEPDNKPSFVGIVYVCTDKTATILKANATVAYSVHVILLNYTKEFCQYLIDHEHTFARLLPVFTASDLNFADENNGGKENKAK